MIKTALILAAGRGDRLRPYTKTTPKPLLMVQNKPLITYHIEKLAITGIKKIIINHAYLGSKIKNYLGNGQAFNLEIEYLPEPPGGLETGGTLAFLKEKIDLNEEILLAINADIFTTYSFQLNKNLPPNSQAHLIMVPQSSYFKKGDFSLTPEGHISLTKPQLIYSGIAYYRIAALEELKIGRYSIRDWFYKKIKNKLITGELFGGQWQDIGTIERWLSLTSSSP